MSDLFIYSPDGKSTPSPGRDLDSNVQVTPHPNEISPAVVQLTSTAITAAALMAKKQRKKDLKAISTTFGHIPGVPVFASWDSRLACSNAAVHRPPMSGISGSGTCGTHSIVLSGSYKDNDDGGETIIYTGSGGRKLWSDTIPQKRLRIGPQIYDQSWDDPPNKSLMVSQQTRNPVRVVRGSGNVSKYAPAEGYRYDGLYTIISCWTSKGLNGHDICRCRLERLPGQPPIPVRPATSSPAKRRRLHTSSASIPNIPVAQSMVESDSSSQQQPSPGAPSASHSFHNNTPGEFVRAFTRGPRQQIRRSNSPSIAPSTESLWRDRLSRQPSEETLTAET